ncbi:MAG: hypothetical protein MRZ79_02710 [Bacteroidia bacterium]|nr:hypothetical protein [Bacteroidia bacterium]
MSKAKHFIIVVLLLLNSRLFACDCPYKAYYAKIGLAEMALTKQDYQAADKLYREALGEFDGFARDYLNASITSAYLKDTSQTLAYSTKAINMGVLFSLLNKKTEFDFIKAHPEWKSLRKKAKNLRKEAIQPSELRDRVYKIYKRDQGLRSFPFNMKIGGKRLFQKRWDRVNSEGFFELKKIILETGYQGEKQIGPAHFVAQDWYAFSVILHNLYRDTDQKLSLILREEMCKGNLPARLYAYIIDRTNLENGKPEIYGSTYIITSLSFIQKGVDLGDQMIRLTEEESKKVNASRQQIGLPLMSQSLKIRKIAPPFYVFL